MGGMDKSIDDDAARLSQFQMLPPEEQQRRIHAFHRELGLATEPILKTLSEVADRRPKLFAVDGDKIEPIPPPADPQLDAIEAKLRELIDSHRDHLARAYGLPPLPEELKP
jgi:hypothetical protein